MGGDLIDGQNFCVDYELASIGDYSFESVSFSDGTSSDGGVLDVNGDGDGGGLSAALEKIRGTPGAAVLIPTVALPGQENDFSGVGGGKQGPVMVDSCGYAFSDPIALDLSPAGWPTLFPVPGQSNVFLPTDGVVPVYSQQDGLGVYPALANFMHTDALGAIGFDATDELNHSDPSNTFPTAVINLLNTPLSTPGVFTKLP